MAKKPKLSKLEQIDLAIRNAHRKQARALDMQKKADRWLRQSAQELVRLHKARQRAELKATEPPVAEHPRVEQREQQLADELVRQAAPMGMVNDGEPVEPVTPAPDVGALYAEASGVKPRRVRKPKPGSEAAALLHQPASDSSGREARMQAMGFRKTKSRAKMSSS